MTRYTIGQVAERTGVSASAIRYYEAHGLMAPAERTDAGYRLFDDAALACLDFIARAKELGCTLEEIADLAELWAADDCEPVQRRLHELVTAKIADSQRQGTEVLRFTAQLQAAAARVGGESIDGPCGDGCACVQDHSASEPDRLMPASADTAIACTLQAGELPQRLADWQDLVQYVAAREALLGSDPGVRLLLRDEVPLHQLAGLVVAEQQCCAFFSFAITVDRRGTALEVRAPSEALTLVDSMFGASN